MAALAPDLRWDLPLRLLGGMHYLVLGGEGSWDDVDAMLDGRSEFLAGFAAEHHPQTNEVARAWALLPGLLSIDLLAGGVERVDLIELGTSAGLLLALDRYGYRYRAGGWGDGSPLLAGDDRGGPPAELLARPLEIGRRRGIDVDPIDAASAEGRRLLEAFVWADQDERRARLRAAIASAAAVPIELVRGDYVDLLPGVLRDRRADALAVVMDSVSTVYLDDARYAELQAVLAAAGEEAPLAWLSLEAPRGATASDTVPVLELTTWPGGERRRLAHVDYHGAWLEWL